MYLIQESIQFGWIWFRFVDPMTEKSSVPQLEMYTLTCVHTTISHISNVSFYQKES